MPFTLQGELTVNAENGALKRENATSASRNVYYDQATYFTGVTIQSLSVTTTKKCLILVVAIVHNESNNPQTQIRRGGVNKTTDAKVSDINSVGHGCYMHLLTAYEVLPAGTYQYDIVSTTTTPRIFATALKVLAVEC